jgi:hypothetical protein
MMWKRSFHIICTDISASEEGAVPKGGPHGLREEKHHQGDFQLVREVGRLHS